MMSIKKKIFNLLLFAILLSLSKRRALGNNIRCLDRDRRALLEFKDKLADEYGRFSSWGTGENKRECCKWRGVYCNNRTNRVTRLNLGVPPQYESIPHDNVAMLKRMLSPSLLELEHLTYLDLSLNDFSYSTIPEFIGSLNQLRYLNLSKCCFKGTVPPSIGNLSKLAYLDLGYNYLSSKNLDWISHLQSVEYLELSDVQIIGENTNWLQAISKLSSIKELHWTHSTLRDVPLPLLPSLNASSHLAIVDISKNSFLSFSSVRWFLNFNNSLTFIDFSDNNITGPISYAFENLRSLAHLDLSYNKLEGGIPKFFGNISLLYLNLQGNILTAQLSELMMNLSEPLEKKLQHLDLGYNRISGSLIDFSRFSSLTLLALGHNKLNGFIGKGYLNIPYLIALDLSSNNFTGPLSDLTLSPSLKMLFLYDNMFNGPVIESIGALSKLEALCIGWNQLEDVITEAHLVNLSRLQILQLSSNSRLALNCSPDWVPTFQLIVASLSGCIIGPHFPNWIQFQTNLVILDISFNQISDNIPQWFGNLASKLVHLNISNNQIHGVFPNITFSTAIYTYTIELDPTIWLGFVLDLSGNRIMGQVLFLCHTRTWRFLNLSDNLFSDQLPECFANFSSLKFLNLANNNFFGEIPHSLGSLLALSWLDLRNNSFSGRIPSSMRSCRSLAMIDLENNRLTGEIPDWLGSRFVNLVVLILRSNEFYGAIPSSMCSLERIQVLDLSSNNISAAIPKCLHFLKAMTQKPTPSTLYDFSIILTSPVQVRLFDGAYLIWKGHEVEYLNGLTLVTLIDLSNNNLAGDIPSEITELVGLVGLNLSRNNLTGSIPQYIGHMNSLDFLDLSRNHLFGDIPMSIWELSILGVLNLSFNNLSGRIPPNSHFDDSAYIGNSLLCGHPILNNSCLGDYEPHRDSSFIDVEHEENSIIADGFYIFMAVGFITGFWGTIGAIIANKSIRYACFKMIDDIGDYIYIKVVLNKGRLKKYISNKQAII